MFADPRRLAVALAGLCAFVDLYATQSLLPLFAEEFHASPAQVSLTVSATTLAVALVAPFVGIAADLLGRKRIIVGAMFCLVAPTVFISFAPDLKALLLGRFAQGLLLPPIFAVTVAYIGDEWPSADVPAVTGIYIAGSGLGGFLGRFLSGLVSEAWGWRVAFGVLGALTIVCAIVVAFLLPREKSFVRSPSMASSFRAMLSHLGDARMIATYVVGFATLFSFVSSFTYVNFHLAAAPFNLTPAWLGSIFVVYLFGVAASPVAGRVMHRFGRGAVVLWAIGCWCAGLLLTLLPSLVAIMAGLAIAAASGFVFQTCATSYLTATATVARSSAVGLYVTCYYIGGSAGAVAPAPAWRLFGWPGCVGLTVAVLLIALVIVLRFWREPRPIQQT
ncbi:MAG TPA: MFS transporter [Alphaproteobacteria bacterium]|nr:MFS transporter [Alphaproteobacteria bacterium]